MADRDAAATKVQTAQRGRSARTNVNKRALLALKDSLDLFFKTAAGKSPSKKKMVALLKAAGAPSLDAAKKVEQEPEGISRLVLCVSIMSFPSPSEPSPSSTIYALDMD